MRASIISPNYEIYRVHSVLAKPERFPCQRQRRMMLALKLFWFVQQQFDINIALQSCINFLIYGNTCMHRS
jgi:hypothetical protein